MFPEKIKITDELIQLIINTRKNDHLTAYQLSEKIGKNKSWLPNIENKRTKNISKSDLYLLFKDNAAKENMSPEQYILHQIFQMHLVPCQIKIQNKMDVEFPLLPFFSRHHRHAQRPDKILRCQSAFFLSESAR